jgi:hypothetical protein
VPTRYSKMATTLPSASPDPDGCYVTVLRPTIITNQQNRMRLVLMPLVSRTRPMKVVLSPSAECACRRNCSMGKQQTAHPEVSTSRQRCSPTLRVRPPTGGFVTRGSLHPFERRDHK